MSQLLNDLNQERTVPYKDPDRIRSLAPEKVYDDGRTIQCHKDECDISKIMARFDQTGTINHLAKHQGTYADFSDFDFHKQTRMLTQGREIFDDLPAEVRQEFQQSPEAFFKYVNNPENADDLESKLKGLAKPSRQLPISELEITPPAEPVPDTPPAPTP